MKIFTNRSKLKKIVIVILTVMLLTFSVPKPVNADAGGILMKPFIAFFTTIVDSIQHVLERFMLGEWNSFMKNISDTSAYNSNGGGATTVDLDAQGIEIGAAWWGDFTGTEIPVIQYTPEEIFSNRVPALDVNFIKPSVTTGNEDWDNDHNIAIKLRPIIAGWYIAMRTMALVGLLSVLVYLGIRMLLTGIAADKAKYKKMLMDWLVAMCLLFALHYIMSFALTMSEVVTSMIANTATGTITVKFGGNTFTGNLMSYVRFMLQAKEGGISLGFFLLYLMLMFYTMKFTWTYLKRVVNMAFLTLIAPLVAVTYPIDKVSDGKAQAFNLWIKEFAFNALLQPLHLLLYIVLLGSATSLVSINPLYAVVCLGFIYAGEKLFKKMFGFDKASGGTIGSLAAAAGLTSLANKAIMSMRKGGNGGGQGKVRTNNRYERQGKDPGANRGYQAFDRADNQGLSELPDVGTQSSRDDNVQEENGGTLPSPDGGSDGVLPMPDGNSGELSIDDQMTQEPDNSTQQNPTPEGTPTVRKAIENLGPEEEPKFFETVGQDFKNFGGRIGNKFNQAKEFGGNLKNKEFRSELFAKGKKKVISGVRKNAIAAWKAAPSAGLNALKVAGRVGGAMALGAVAGAAGAALTGDAEQSLGMAFAGAAGGNAISGKVLNSTVGRANHNRTTREAFGAAKYGSKQDYINAKSDKAYIKSEAHRDEYEKYFKDGRYAMSKEEFDRATREYRQVGITDTKQIRKALHLEAKYAEENGGDRKTIRKKVQNIAQSYDAIDRKAVYGSDKNATQATLRNIEGQLGLSDARQKRAVANEILQGYRDWYNTP